MEYTEEQDITEAGGTSQEERSLGEKDPETRRVANWSKVMSHVFKQIFIRGVAVYLFYNVFLFLVQGWKGSVQEYVNDGKCPLDEK